MRKDKVFKVVVGLKMQSYAGQRKLAGIFRFLSDKYLWDLTLLRSTNELSLDFIERTNHKTDGYLLSLHESAEARRALIKTGKPIVYLDAVDLNSIPPDGTVSFLKIDQNAIGRTAANHLLGLSQFKTFAFVHAVGNPHWSVGRAEGFANALARRQKTVAIYDNSSLSSDAAELAQWIKALPKPATIFAAFDDRAIDVINACRTVGVKIPNDVTVLGAGDDELICNSSRPTLSSVRIPFEHHGFMAARELQAKMMLPINRNRVLKTENDFAISQRQTTASTTVFNALVHDGLTFIATFATSGIKVPDVVKHLNVSRRLADLRFRQSTGKSILQTIIEAQIDEAKRLLRTTTLSIADIADRCGFTSANYFKNVFTRTVGKSPRAWRSDRAQQPS